MFAKPKRLPSEEIVDRERFVIVYNGPGAVVHDLQRSYICYIHILAMPHAHQDEVSDFPSNTTLPDLYVNDGKLERSQIGQLRPSTVDLPLEELRSRFEDDGYLFVKHLIPRAAVLKAREEYFKFLEPTGVLKPGTKPIDGIFDDEKDRLQFPGIGSGAAGGNGHPGDHAALFVDQALKAHYQDWYAEDLCKQPALKDFIAKLTGWGPNTHALVRSLLRNNVPGNKAIGVHYGRFEIL